MKTLINGLYFFFSTSLIISTVYCENYAQNWNNKFSEAINKRLYDLETKQNICENKIERLEAALQKARVNKRSIIGENVAFSTLLSKDQDHIGLSQTIKFDHVLLNDGNGYSVHSGTFTAPTDGVYMFTYLFAHGGAVIGQVWLELMKNGNKINAGVTDTFHTYQDLQGGNVAIIRVQAGDAIWVESFHQNDAKIFGTPGFTTFSGVLLY